MTKRSIYDKPAPTGDDRKTLVITIIFMAAMMGIGLLALLT